MSKGLIQNCHFVSIKTIPIFSQPKTTKFPTLALSRKKDLSLKISKRSPRRLVTISTGDGKWHGNWTSEFSISLKDLSLQDLIEDQHHSNTDALLSVILTVQKHASFGFSVEGRILTSFTRNCANCCSPYCRQIDSKFNVWVLQSNKDNDELQLPELGGDDPSVIYVKPGCEANLDSLIRDTLRLTVSDFCSESCEKSPPTLQIIGRHSAASIDKRWSGLLELKKSAS